MNINRPILGVGIASLSGLLAALSTIAPSGVRAADAGSEGQTLEEVVVTGSRLSSAGFNAPTPVTVVGVETIEQRAPANIADVINEQPAFRVSSSDTTRGGTQPGSGQQTLNLRALGAVRTLVLLNGHRIAPTLWDGTVDTAIIPTGLVERIEVVTGGASAAYGSDAVAGVTNIILRNQMHGIRASVQGGLTEYDTAKQVTATLAGGNSFFGDRLDLIGGIDYSDSKAIRDAYGKAWGRNEIATITPAAAQRTANASNPLPQSIVSSGVEPGSAAPGGLFQASNTVGVTPGVAYTFDANGNPVPFSQGTLWGTAANANLLMTGTTGNYGYSNASVNSLRAPTRRIDIYGRGSFALTEHTKAYLELNKSLNVVDPFKSAEYIAQGGANGTAGMPQLTIARTNPFVTPALTALLNSTLASTATTFNIGRINTEFGLGSPFGIAGVAYKATTDVRRILAGLQGEFAGNWKWDAYIQRGTTDLKTQRQEYSPSALQFAVDGCTGTVGLSAAQQTALSTYQQVTGKSCVAFNPFGVGRNAVSAQNYFMQMIWTRQELAQNVFAASISGKVLDLPAGPLAVATGAEYRRDQARGTVDNVTAVGSLLSNNFQPLARDNQSAKWNIVREAFVEVGVPLLKDKPFARSLDLNTAVRRTSYSQSGLVSTWKAGFTWDPFDFLRVRYARSRDIRAPNLNDIYFQGGLGISGNLINHVPLGVVGANGVANINPAGLTNTLNLNVTQNGASGGGSLLRPEIADTHTFGVVLRKGGFDASLDYYQITIKGLINTPAAQQVIDGCAAGDPRLCQMITFDPVPANVATNGGLALVAPTALNLITQTVQGYDFEMGYRMAVLGGNFSVRGLVNYQPRNRSFNPIFNRTTDAANVLGNQPLVSYNLSLGFQKGRLNTDVQLRGFTGRRGNATVYNPDGTIAISAAVSNTALYTVLGPEDPGYVVTNAGTVSKNRFAGQYTVNPSVNYKINDHVGAFLTIDNLFDAAPPALTTNASYDLIGRRYRAGVRAEF